MKQYLEFPVLENTEHQLKHYHYKLKNTQKTFYVWLNSCDTKPERTRRGVQQCWDWADVCTDSVEEITQHGNLRLSLLMFKSRQQIRSWVGLPTEVHWTETFVGIKVLKSLDFSESRKKEPNKALNYSLCDSDLIKIVRSPENVKSHQCFAPARESKLCAEDLASQRHACQGR